MTAAKAILLSVLGLTIAAVTSRAVLAQEPALPAPVAAKAEDHNGVDIMSGSFSDPAPSISVGPVGGGLTFQRVMNDRGRWTDNVTGSVIKTCEWDHVSNDCSHPLGVFMNVSIGGLAGAVFQQQEDGTWTSMNGSSASLTGSGNNWTYTAPDGSVATYGLPSVKDYYGWRDINLLQSSLGSIQTLRRPNGEILTYHYRETAPGVSVVSSVNTNTGYQLHFEYNGTILPQMVRAVALNNGQESCLVTSETCALTGNWPSLTFAQSIDSRTVTDSLGRTTHYTYAMPPGGIAARIVAVRRPGRATGNDLVIDYGRIVPQEQPAKESPGPVRSVTTDSGVWTYRSLNHPHDRSVIDPLGNIFSYETMNYDSLSGVSRLRTSTSPLGQTTTNAYEHRVGLGPVLLSVTQPEGNKVLYSYDARGNVTQERVVSKTPGAPADVVRSATYPATCVNPVTCNLPTSVTDARGNVTDYTYDAAGNLLTVTGPAPTPGAPRPQTRYVWEQRYAWYKQNGSSTITQAPTPVWVQVSQSQCMTGATC